MSPDGYASSAAEIARICAAAEDSRTLRLEILEAIRRAVPFDAYSWLLTDPQSCVGSGPLADVPCLAELPELISLKYRTPLNRWTTLTAAPVARLHDATVGDLSRSLMWRDLLARYGVIDVASVVFIDQFGCWAFLDLWRSDDHPPFRATDARFLADATQIVTNALRRTQANTFVRSRADANEPDTPQPPGPFVLVLSSELHVRAQTPDAHEYLRVLVPPSPDAQPIPSGAYNVAAQLLAAEAGVDDHAPVARVHLADGRWVTLRAARMGGPGDGSDIAVTIEEASAAERTDLFARAFGLSARESELLGHLTTGADTRELASRMFVSGHTVQDHLKAIFAKTSIHSRRELVSLVLGARS